MNRFKCLVAWIFAGAIGLVGAIDPAAAESKLRVVKLGIVPVVDVAPIYLGIEKGFFVEEGLQIEPLLGQGGPALIAGVVSSTLNIGISASVPLIQARGAGLNVVALAAARGRSENRPDSGLVVRVDSEIKTAKDLAGKVVAVNGLKSINELFIRVDADQKGGDASAIKFLEMPFPNMSAALEAKRVDAVAVVEPFLSGLLAAGGRVVLNYINDTVTPGTATTYWFTSKEQISANPELFERFLRAFAKSVAYAEANPDEIKKTLLTFTRLTPKQVENLVVPSFKAEMQASEFVRHGNFMIKYQFLTEKPNLDGITWSR